MNEKIMELVKSGDKDSFMLAMSLYPQSARFWFDMIAKNPIDGDFGMMIISDGCFLYIKQEKRFYDVTHLTL